MCGRRGGRGKGGKDIGGGGGNTPYVTAVYAPCSE